MTKRRNSQSVEVPLSGESSNECDAQQTEQDEITFSSLMFSPDYSGLKESGSSETQPVFQLCFQKKKPDDSLRIQKFLLPTAGLALAGAVTLLLLATTPILFFLAVAGIVFGGCIAVSTTAWYLYTLHEINMHEKSSLALNP